MYEERAKVIEVSIGKINNETNLLKNNTSHTIIISDCDSSCAFGSYVSRGATADQFYVILLIVFSPNKVITDWQIQRHTQASFSSESLDKVDRRTIVYNTSLTGGF